MTWATLKKKFVKLPWPKIGVLFVRSCIVVLSLVIIILTESIYDKTLAGMPDAKSRLEEAEKILEEREKEKYVDWAVKQNPNRSYESLHDEYVGRNDKFIAGLIPYQQGVKFRAGLDRIEISAVFILLATLLAIAIMALRWKLPPRFVLVFKIIRIADIFVIILLVIGGLLMYGVGLGNNTVVPFQEEAVGIDVTKEELYIDLCSDLLKGKQSHDAFPLKSVEVTKENVKCLTEEANELRGVASLITCVTGGIALVLEMFVAMSPRRWDI